MTGTPASASVLALAACVVLPGAWLIQGPAWAQETASADQGAAGLAHFDIPAQSLADALKSFDRLTHLSVLVQSSVLDRRTSAPVLGDYTPRDALQYMLAGTGLQARFPGLDAVTIVAAPVGEPNLMPPPPAVIASQAIDGALAGGADYRPYLAMVQMRVTQALCESPQTRPGSYRLAVRLRIGDGGRVVASRIAGSTGDAARDAAIARTMRTLVLDAPAPASMPEPVTFLLRPEGAGVLADCAPRAPHDDED
jgi:hypothetical protein